MNLNENGTKISDFKLEITEQKNIRKQVIFILFENSFWPSYDDQRIYLKKLLLENLSQGLSNDDILYFSEFDWTDENGKAIYSNRIKKGNVSDILIEIEKIQKPKSDGRLHQFSEVNTALLNTLDFLDKVR